MVLPGISRILNRLALEFLLKICIKQNTFQIMPKFYAGLMLSSSYYAKNYAGIIDSGL